MYRTISCYGNSHTPTPTEQSHLTYSTIPFNCTNFEQNLLNLAHLKNHLSPHVNMSTRVMGYWSQRHLTPNWGFLGHLLLCWHWVNLWPSSITEKFSRPPIPGTLTDVGVIVCMFFYFLNFTAAHVAAGGAGSRSAVDTFCTCCFPLHFRFLLHFCQSFALYYLCILHVITTLIMKVLF